MDNQMGMNPQAQAQANVDQINAEFTNAFGKAKEQFGHLRKAGAILQANPMGMLINELVFPPAAAGGELSEVLNRFGPGAVNREPSSTYDPTL